MTFDNLYASSCNVVPLVNYYTVAFCYSNNCLKKLNRMPIDNVLNAKMLVFLVRPTKQRRVLDIWTEIYVIYRATD